MTEIMRKTEGDIARYWNRLYIQNMHPIPSRYWAVTDIRPGVVDQQLLVECYNGVGINGLYIPFLFNGDWSFELPGDDWQWNPKKELMSYRLAGNLTVTRFGGTAEHSGECEALFVADPETPSAIVRNVFFSHDPGILRSQPHHSLIIRFTLCIDGQPVPDVTGERLLEIEKSIEKLKFQLLTQTTN